MNILAKLRKYREQEQQEQQQEESSEQENEQEPQKDIAQIENEVRERISKFLYDSELIEEMLPLFMRLNEIEGGDKIYELVEAKETELQTVLENESAFEQDTSPDQKDIADNESDDDEKDQNLVLDILSERYNTEI